MNRSQIAITTTWLKEIYGWKSAQTYAFVIYKESGKTLGEMRREYMDKQVEIIAEDENI